ncbi:hypothetical protein JEZ13_06100 [bacterium]|nr:hypothetical protein [bacterium]
MPNNNLSSRGATQKALDVPLLWSLWIVFSFLNYKDVAASAAGRMVCFYNPVSVVNMAYFKDTSIFFF